MTLPDCPACPLVHPLSVRELEVLRHVALGLTNKEIGRVLRISHYTVDHHMGNILLKLDVSDRTAAVVIIMRAGLLR